MAVPTFAGKNVQLTKVVKVSRLPERITTQIDSNNLTGLQKTARTMQQIQMTAQCEMHLNTALCKFTASLTSPQRRLNVIFCTAHSLCFITWPCKGSEACSLLVHKSTQADILVRFTTVRQSVIPCSTCETVQYGRMRNKGYSVHLAIKE